MIIAFLGKGGSGKSTISSGFVMHQHQTGKKVLAIDVDHNMDMAYNISPTDNLVYFGDTVGTYLRKLGVSTNSWRDVFALDPLPEFFFKEEDPFLELAGNKIAENLYLLVAGPHTDTVLSGKMCSHGLATPLKIFLPLLNTNEQEMVVLDEKAGVDGAGTGIPTGVHCVAVVVEPTVASTKAAVQIIEVLKHFEVEYFLVGNKVRQEEDIFYISERTGMICAVYFPFSSQVLDSIQMSHHYTEQFQALFDTVSKLIEEKGDFRKEKTLKKLSSFSN